MPRHLGPTKKAELSGFVFLEEREEKDDGGGLKVELRCIAYGK